MWCPLFLLLLIGAASGEHFQAWKTDTQYQYHVRSRTLTALHDFSNQYTGLIVKGLLTIRPKNVDTLDAKFSDVQYARIHTKLTDGWQSKIPDNILDLKRLPMSEKVFEIKMRYGVVRDLIVDKDVPTWEVNMLKSIVSQLQVDMQGENMMSSRFNQEPVKNRVNALFKTMEDSVGGKCEVVYDINTIPDFVLRSRPELIPKFDLRGAGRIIEIMKTKNYCNCQERINYHFGTTKSNNWEPCANDNGKSISQSSVSRIVVTGDLEIYTIQSSVTTHEVILSPNLHENKKGMVSSMVNITLVKMDAVPSDAWSTPANLESVGNLVYSYKNPFAGTSENRDEYRRRLILKSRNSDENWNLQNSHRGQGSEHDGFGASRSTSDENSFESNQDQWYWHPTSSLNEAPITPLLPFFMDNRGKSIAESGKVDLVMTSKTVADQIGRDLENPDNITDQQTLEKFTILATLIRTMNIEQIAEVQREIYQFDNETNSNDENKRVRQNSWAAFRDAVAQAGTGPALITIKNWIKETKIKGIEAALVVAVLSKTARAPTPEYVNAFFEMVTMPETTDQEFLNSTAMVTFTELIRYSQVNHDNVQNHRPVSSFARPSPKNNPAIIREYIPYLAEQLKKSIKNNEFARSHVFIRALGNIAHPKILTVFEPYLEGEIHATTFQRLLMVFSLNNLAALKPRLARGVFYRIYQNTAETHQLRSAAVAFLMSTNPPASMLQRMAEFTNYDHSRQVNAAIKSAIKSASKLEAPESQDLATKARNVLSLLNDESYDNENTDNFFSDYDASELNLGYRTQAYFARDDFISLAFYASLQARYGDFEVPKSEIGALLSSLKEIYTLNGKKYTTDYSDDSEKNGNHEFSLNKIAELLKIKKENNENLEGAFWVSTQYNNQFLSFDKQSLQRIPELIMRAGELFMEGRDFNMAKMESYDLTLSFPMESGLPFFYTMKLPTLLKLSGNVKGEQVSDVINATIEIRLVYSMQIQGRLGFVTPFDRQHYMAGVNKNLQAHGPIRIEAKLDKNEKRITMKFQPIEQDERYRLAHYSLVPFTSRHSILNISPVMQDEETRKLINGKIWKRASRIRNLNYEMETDSKTGGSMDRSNWDPVARSIFAFAEDNPEYSKAEIYFEPDESGDQSVVLTALFDYMHNETTAYDENRSKAIPKATAPIIKSKKLYDSERVQELMVNATEGISYVVAYGLDLGVEIPGEEPSQMLLTAAYAISLIDEKSRGLAYWRVMDPLWFIEFETCAGLELKSPRMDTIKMDDNLFFKDDGKYRNFDVDVRLGVTCDNAYSIQIHGDQEQTVQYKTSVYDMPVLSVCMKDVLTGIRPTPACKDAGDKIYTMDKSHIIVKFDPTIRDFDEEVPKYFSIMNNIPGIKSSIMEKLQKDESIADNSLEFSVNVDPVNNIANFSCESSRQRLTAEDLTIPIGLLIMNLHHDLSDVSERLFMNLTDEDSLHNICEFDSIKATTFDNATYPVELGKCWHVAATNYPKTNVMAATRYPDAMSFSVLIRDSNDSVEDTKKDLLIVTESNEVRFTVVDGNIHVTLDGKPFDLNEKDNSSDLNFKLLKESDGAVKFFYPLYDFDVLYDGNRVQIKASEDYRSKMRGLCGNYDGEPTNDFISPRDCPLSKPEEFVAAFALVSSDCEGPSFENLRKANDGICDHKAIRSGNVVSDREAGRSKSGNSNWGFHNRMNSNDEKGQETGNSKRCTSMLTKIIEEDDQTCFSLRPMPSCAYGCKSSRTKPKVVPVYCMPKGPGSQQMAERIKKGANPDLSQKTLSKKSGFDIPVHCHSV